MTPWGLWRNEEEERVRRERDRDFVDADMGGDLQG